ncbi:hypothetical protein [Roseibium salinum]|uniref:Major facilitator superfamily (MFS) profile domain-containing protein n=1 Tax=Roseibium salinum TaxID=1604349 RepID=A0ABT3QXW3_9HYPH|nr:hypothetical protein [Roseibium sp. DSM 29163]MCX2721676.1 hypothetical protein [Roseibium sp. DSM 29163]MDN3720276.1 hypothetical protein [Roseibium salinum]
MRVVWAILGAVAGLVIGYIGSVVVIYPIVVAIDGPDRDGGLAMGVAFTIAPALAVIIAVICFIVSLRLTRRKKPAAGPGGNSGI